MSRRDDLLKIHALAAQHERVIGRGALLKAGLSRRVVAGYLGSGQLTRVLDGVYLFGGAALSQRQLFWAAVLFAGPTSGLDGYSAGEQRGIVRPNNGQVTVATGRPRVTRSLRALVPMDDGRPGFVTVNPTRAARFVEFDGFPVVPMARTLIKIGVARGARAAERAWKEADYRRLLDLDELRNEVRSTRSPGNPILRRLLETMPTPVDQSVDIRSRDEISFLDLVGRAGLPRPEVNVPMNVSGKSYVADFYYAELGLVVEVDDPSHRRPVAQGRDRIRDVEFFIQGLDVMRFETHRLAREPDDCMRQLAAGIDRLRRRGRSA